MANKRTPPPIATRLAVSEGRQKLLDALATGKTFASISELCDYAGVNRSTYYDAVNNDKFRKQLVESTRSTLYADLPSIMRAVVKQAKRGSFPHQKLYLETVGVAEQGKGTTVNAAIQIVTNVPTEKAVTHLASGNASQTTKEE